MSVRGRGFSKYTRLDQARELIFSKIKEVNSEEIPFSEAVDRVLSKDIKSEVNVPPFDRAAMDGYAVQAEDTFGAEETDPNLLKVIGSIEIGSNPKLEIKKGEAARIATGAPMPEGANATVIIEETNRTNSEVEVFSPVSPGENVSSRGEDVEAGQTVLKAPCRIRPSDVGILASTKNLEISVRRKPKVGIAITGDELREPGEEINSGEITETNSYVLGPAVERSGGEPVRIGIIPDRLGEIKEVLKRASDFDVLVLTGGSSVGEKDLVPLAISEEGELILHGIAMRPGGPSAFGVVEGTPVFSLAGFPAAAVLAFEMIVRPALRVMQGLPGGGFEPEVVAELVRKVSSSLGRVDVVRVGLREEDGEYLAEPIRVTGSSVLRSVSEADGILTVSEESEGFARGDVVGVRLSDL